MEAGAARRFLKSFLVIAGGRLVQALMVALIVGAIGFAMMEALPGDAEFRIAAARYGYDNVTADAAAQVRAELGLDRPAPLRLLAWLGDTVSFDLGRSAVTGEPVSRLIASQLGPTIDLSVTAFVFALLISTPIGCLAGLAPGGAFDRISATLSVALRSTPAFLLGVALMLLLAVELRLLPAAGHHSPEHLVLPALTLALALSAVLTRVIRNAVADVVAGEPFRFGRLKGLSLSATLWRHGLRNAAPPVVAYLGVQAALLLEGVVVVESVFAWPGIGHALTHAIFERDVPMLQGTALALGLIFVMVSFVADIACRALDPRLGP